MASETIDYLFEDPKINGQNFALVSIIGPHMPQKCDVWGLKVRGTADTLEMAQAMARKLMRIDNHYDIFTVEVGKFFPLAVEPQQVDKVEYQNTQLNELIKGYLENKELANEHWLQRKNEMIQEAIKEGKTQESSSRPEHPIAVLQRIKSLDETVVNLRQELESTEQRLKKSKDVFSNYSEEERKIANEELLATVKTVVNTTTNNPEMSVEEIRTQLITELDANQSVEPKSEVENLLDELKIREQQLDNENDNEKLQQEILELKEKLQNKNLVNDYINQNYSEPNYQF